MSTIVEELASVVAQLPEREQERVLSFARELARPPDFPHTPLPPLDSSVLIRSLRGDAVVSARIYTLPNVYVSSIVLGELFVGATALPLDRMPPLRMSRR